MEYPDFGRTGKIVEWNQGDLQKPAEGGPRDLYRVRRDRSTDSFFKRITAGTNYLLLRSLGADIVVHQADFRLLVRRALDSLSDFREVNLFPRGIIPLVGFETAEVHFDRSERAAGASRYPRPG